MICRSWATIRPVIQRQRAGRTTELRKRIPVRFVKGAVIRSAAIWAFSAVASTAHGASDCNAGRWEQIETVTVADARTIVLGDGLSVRLAGIDSLAVLARDRQTADVMDTRLTDQLAQWLTAMPLRAHILPDKPDRHGRRAALILAGGELLQKRLLDAGLAVLMPGSLPDSGPYSADDIGNVCAKQLLAVEAAARRSRRGSWSDPRFRVIAARPDALSTQFGHFVIFQGIVRSVGTRRDRTYIDFGRQWRSDVTVEITAARRKYFGGEAALERLTGKTLRIRGFLEEKAGPMVLARHPTQIEVLPE